MRYSPVRWLDRQSLCFFTVLLLLVLWGCWPTAEEPAPPPDPAPPVEAPEWPPAEADLVEQAVASVGDLFEVDLDAAQAQAMTADEVRAWIETYRNEGNAASLGDLVDSIATPALAAVDGGARVGIRFPDVYKLPCARIADVIYVPARREIMRGALPNSPADPAAGPAPIPLPRPGFGGVVLADFCSDGNADEQWCRNCSGCEGPSPPGCDTHGICVCTKSQKRCRECPTCTGC